MEEGGEKRGLSPSAVVMVYVQDPKGTSSSAAAWSAEISDRSSEGVPMELDNQEHPPAPVRIVVHERNQRPRAAGMKC